MKHFWTAPEHKLIRAHYGEPGGIDKLCELLPHRTRGAIYQQGIKLGLRGHQQPATRHKVYKLDEHIDNAIRGVYYSAPTRNAINDLAKRIMRPRWWVSKRAMALGLVVPRYKDAPWSDLEVELLRKNAHKKPWVIQRALKQAGYSRTETAITVKLKRAHIDTSDPNHYTATALSRLMGVDAKTVTRWIERNGLRAKRRGTARTESQGGDQWWIARKDVRLWIADNAALVDLRKVDRFWFIDLMIGRYETEAAA